MTINFYPTDNPGIQARKLNQLRDLVGEGGGGGGPVAWDDVTDKPSTFTPASHTQAISTIDGLQTALDAKAATSHGHAISDVTGLQTALDGKAAASARSHRSTQWRSTSGPIFRASRSSGRSPRARMRGILNSHPARSS